MKHTPVSYVVGAGVRRTQKQNRRAAAGSWATGPGLAVAVTLILASQTASAKSLGPFKPPTLGVSGQLTEWAARKPSDNKLIARGQGLIDLDRWPQEPVARGAEVNHLGNVLKRLCSRLDNKTARHYAEWIVGYSVLFDVDPFLLGAVIYDRSRCKAERSDGPRIGLAGIDAQMHRPFAQNGQYRYWTKVGNDWEERVRNIGAFDFTPKSLKSAQANIYFAAALLSIFKEQCHQIDGVFGSIPHRHHVSHLVWGDRVRDNGAEDAILRARRRLINHYRNTPSTPAGNFLDLALHSPLEGWPRKITGVPGDDRDGGRRRHQGIDFLSSFGEPVRAVASGVVMRAGVDMKVGPTRNLPSWRARRIRPRRMGAGGLYVMIKHENGLVSAYMHLANYHVRVGDKVAAGELIGYVGRSGIRRSPAHLHFELRFLGKHLNPLVHLAPMVIPPDATYVGRRIMARKRRIRRARWARRARRKRKNRSLLSQATAP